MYAAPPDVLRGGESASVLEPFAGPRSILILHGDEHCASGKLMLPPFHGEALERWATRSPSSRTRSWTRGDRAAACARWSGCRRLTLEVIQRVVFGSRDRAARRAARARWT